MTVSALADNSLELFRSRLIPLTAVHVIERIGESTSPLSSLELDEEGGLLVVDLFTGDVKHVFLAGQWTEGRTLLDGVTLTRFLPPVHEFDETDLALGRDF